MSLALRPVASDLAAEAALRPLLRAGRLSRLRAMEAVCPAGHRLVDVLRSPTGLLAVAGSVAVFLGEPPDPGKAQRPRDLVDLGADGTVRVVGMLRRPAFVPERYGGAALSTRRAHRRALIPMVWIAE